MAFGCTAPDARPGGERPPASDFAGVFDLVREIHLEETSQVVNVAIRVHADPVRGFLVADEREAQVRWYREHGALLWWGGRRGQGPGEFEAAIEAVPLPSGGVVVGDRSGRLTVFDPPGTEPVRTMETQMRHLAGLWVHDAATLLISGFHPAGPMEPRLHVWSMESQRIERSFFAPLPASANPELSAVVGWTRSTLRADTVVAAFATMDTLFFFESGVPVRQVPFPPSQFRRVSAPEGPARSGPGEGAEFLSRFDYVSDIFALGDEGVLIQYQSVIPDEALGRRWHLLGMTWDGIRPGLDRTTELPSRQEGRMAACSPPPRQCGPARTPFHSTSGRRDRHRPERPSERGAPPHPGVGPRDPPVGLSAIATSPPASSPWR